MPVADEKYQQEDGHDIIPCEELNTYCCGSDTLCCIPQSMFSILAATSASKRHWPTVHARDQDERRQYDQEQESEQPTIVTIVEDGPKSTVVVVATNTYYPIQPTKPSVYLKPDGNKELGDEATKTSGDTVSETGSLNNSQKGNSTSGGGGMTLEVKVSLGVGIGLGIPTTIATIWMCLFR